MTHRHTDPSTVTLAAHACRGLITSILREEKGQHFLLAMVASKGKESHGIVTRLSGNHLTHIQTLVSRDTITSFHFSNCISHSTFITTLYGLCVGGEGNRLSTSNSCGTTLLLFIVATLRMECLVGNVEVTKHVYCLSMIYGEHTTK